MPRTELNRVRDMLEAAKMAVEYVAGTNFEQFAADTKTVDAVVRRLEIVGEAAKSVGKHLGHSNRKFPGQLLGAHATV